MEIAAIFFIEKNGTIDKDCLFAPINKKLTGDSQPSVSFWIKKVNFICYQFPSARVFNTDWKCSGSGASKYSSSPVRGCTKPSA